MERKAQRNRSAAKRPDGGARQGSNRIFRCLADLGEADADADADPKLFKQKKRTGRFGLPLPNRFVRILVSDSEKGCLPIHDACMAIPGNRESSFCELPESRD
jgi:hypothetical protein